MNDSHKPKIKITFAEAIATIKQRNLEIIDLKAKILKLEQRIDIMSDARMNDVQDFLKGFGKK